ncbi:MAG: chemotaxis protein CheW [Mariprofundaceae bacterium]
MLLLCFSLGDERFALETSKVQELIPMVRMKKIPKTPEWVSGVMRYHGQTVPVIDMCTLNLARNSEQLMSTRIIVVRYCAQDQTEHLLGLLAEQVTETLHRQAKDFTPIGVHAPESSHLGGLASDQDGMLQWVEIDQLLPEGVQKLLFQNTRDSGR